LQQLTKYSIMCPLYSRQVSALILDHHQVNLKIIKRKRTYQQLRLLSVEWLCHKVSMIWKECEFKWSLNLTLGKIPAFFWRD
jgi:hypothetical protein